MTPKVSTAKPASPRQVRTWEPLLESLRRDRAQIAEGGGPKAIERQHEKKRLTARERVARLIDPDTLVLRVRPLLRLGHVRRVGTGSGGQRALRRRNSRRGRRFMLVVNDATVKAGSFFPMTVKKVLRAQRIALVNRLPLIYLVDSAGVMLPLQEDVFPDEDDFGRIFRNNAVLSALGVPQIAAIMGNCVAGGGYLPVLVRQADHDRRLGPLSRRAGARQKRDRAGRRPRRAGRRQDARGDQRHDRLSRAGRRRGPDPRARAGRHAAARSASLAVSSRGRRSPRPARPKRFTRSSPPNGKHRTKSATCSSASSMPDTFQEYKADYGRTVICGYARIGGFDVGMLVNQHHPEKTRREGLQYGGVIYHDSADKMARFIMDCNQTWTPLVFLQDVSGFMVGRDSEQSGIIRAGAKVVNAISNSRVPKLTVILGGSYGAGNYAMCGKAFDPRFIFAWPTAEYAVMGSAQAASTLLDVNIAAMKRTGHDRRRGRAGRNPPQGDRGLRRVPRPALRRRPRLGRRDHRAGRNARRADRSARSRHPPRGRRTVPHGRAAGVRSCASSLRERTILLALARRLRKPRETRRRWPRPFSRVQSAAGNSCLPSW